jgi:hypothetical protein
MTTIVVDKELREKLKEMDGEILLCDEAGHALGRFLPEAEYREHMRMVYDHAREMFAAEDVESARSDPEELTTAQVLEHLKRL